MIGAHVELIVCRWNNRSQWDCAEVRAIQLNPRTEKFMLLLLMRDHTFKTIEANSDIRLLNDDEINRYNRNARARELRRQKERKRR